MNPQDLKQGQSYLILANYYGNDCDNDHHFIAVPSKSRFYLDERAVRTCVSLPSEPPTLVGSSNGTRLFRKGDIVKIIDWNGRKMIDHAAGRTYTVTKDEVADGYNGVSIKHEENGQLKGWTRVHACNLELVTPIEELEPYEVTESTDYFAVENRSKGDEVATFWKERHPNPKEAAEIECARLNAEHRKNLNND